MLTIALSVYDSKADCFSPPFFSRSRGEGLRNFADAGRDQQSSLSRHPEDFSLYQIGVFNDSDGRFASQEPERLSSLSELLIKPE